MEGILSLGLIIALISVLTFVADGQKSCEFEFHVKPQHHLSMGLANFTKTSGKRHKLCKILIRADEGTRIVLDLFYSPRKRPAYASSCTSDYVHVGNDVRRVDIQLMTSYKFCEKRAKHELVSRDNEMWFVYKAYTSKPKDLNVNIQAKVPVTCRSDEFMCSPVQCVDQSKICDGTLDCSNGHDEYCLIPSPQSGQTEETEPCFRCGEGTCITPRLPRYDNAWGRVLWYLCDGFSHCPDGWDERADMCFLLPKGRVGSVTECVPSDRRYGSKRRVIMWNDVRCDDVTDCYHGEDEVRCGKNGQDTNRLNVKPLTIGIITGIMATLASAIGIFIFRRQRRGRSGVRPSMGSAAETNCTQCTSCDGDPSCGHQHRSASCCSATVPVVEMANVGNKGVGCHGHGTEKNVTKSGHHNVSDDVCPDKKQMMDRKLDNCEKVNKGNEDTVDQTAEDKTCF